MTITIKNESENFKMSSLHPVAELIMNAQKALGYLSEAYIESDADGVYDWAVDLKNYAAQIEEKYEGLIGERPGFEKAQEGEADAG